MMVQTNIANAKRRAHEVSEVAGMVQEDGMNNIMSAAAAQKLFWIDSLKTSLRLLDKPAETVREALHAIMDAAGYCHSNREQ